MDIIDKKLHKLIQDRKESKGSYEEVYSQGLGINVSSDEARKRIRGLEDLFNFKIKNEVEVANELGEEVKYTETTEILKNGDYSSDKLLRMSREQSKDVNFLLKAHGFDGDFWQVVSARNNIWNVYSKQDGVQQLYSSKITVKPIVPEFKVEWIEETIKDMVFKKRRINKYNYGNLESGKVAEVNFPDAHLGKFVSELVSNGVYDIDIAVDRYQKAIEDAISKMQMFPIKKIIYAVGQDYLNVDTMEGTTHAGTRQDMNEFYESLYRKGLICLHESIEKLRSVAPVHVVYIKGNHDVQTTFTMVCGLERVYESEEGVTFDSGIKQRKYVTFGDVLIGYSHGEKEKKKIFDCMQNDEKEDWHKKRKYFHLSHLHSESKIEKGGVIYRWLGSLSENCSWTWGSGYVGAEKKGHLFIYDDIQGMIAEFFIKA